jgi:hypothetical protein
MKTSMEKFIKWWENDVKEGLHWQCKDTWAGRTIFEHARSLLAAENASRIKARLDDPLRNALWELVEEMEANIKESGSYSVSATDIVDDLKKALGKVEQKPTAPASFQDYDAGLLSDYGGGNVAWWMDYIRGELERCNEHWREQLSAHQTEKPTQG